MPEALAAAGYLIEPHAKHFAHDAPDVEWLRAAGARRWAVLTKDHAIRHNPMERAALMEAGVRAFVLTSGQMTAADMAAVFIKQMPKIERLAQKTRGAFIARVTRTEVTIVVPEPDAG